MFYDAHNSLRGEDIVLASRSVMLLLGGLLLPASPVLSHPLADSRLSGSTEALLLPASWLRFRLLDNADFRVGNGLLGPAQPALLALPPLLATTRRMRRLRGRGALRGRQPELAPDRFDFALELGDVRLRSKGGHLSQLLIVHVLFLLDTASMAVSPSLLYSIFKY